MDTSLLLARIIGPYMLIAAIGLMVNRAGYKRLLDELQGQTLLLLVMGAFTLILGLLMLQFHNIWVSDWRVLITIIGWTITIKGATTMIAPDTIIRFANGFSANQTVLNIHGVLTLLFGAFMSYMGYFA